MRLQKLFFPTALFNAAMLGLALWRQWDVVVVLIAYVVESLLYSVFLVPVEDWGTRRVPFGVLPFAFVNMSLLIFLFFSAYTYDSSVFEVFVAVAAVCLGFFVQYASVDVPTAPFPGQPSKWEVWFRTVPALLSVFLLSSLIDSSASVDETSFVILVFYPVKTFLEISALLVREAFPPVPVHAASSRKKQRR